MLINFKFLYLYCCVRILRWVMFQEIVLRYLLIINYNLSCALKFVNNCNNEYNSILNNKIPLVIVYNEDFLRGHWFRIKLNKYYFTRRILRRGSTFFSRVLTLLFLKINAKMFYLIFSRFRDKMISSSHIPTKL